MFTEKMLGMIYQIEKLVDLKPVNLVQRRLNFWNIEYSFFGLTNKKISINWFC